jgi:hypothetical protein
MDKEKLPSFEIDVSTSEVQLNQKSDLRNDSTQYNSPNVTFKKRLLAVLRIRRFFIRQSRSKRPMEFGAHPTGIHWMGQAIFHSESGCVICKTDLEELA